MGFICLICSAKYYTQRALEVLNPFPPRFDLLQSHRPEYLKLPSYPYDPAIFHFFGRRWIHIARVPWIMGKSRLIQCGCINRFKSKIYRSVKTRPSSLGTFSQEINRLVLFVKRLLETKFSTESVKLITLFVGFLWVAHMNDYWLPSLPWWYGHNLKIGSCPNFYAHLILVVVEKLLSYYVTQWHIHAI